MPIMKQFVIIWGSPLGSTGPVYAFSSIYKVCSAEWQSGDSKFLIECSDTGGDESR